MSSIDHSQSVRTPYLPPGTVITETDLRSVYIGRLPENVVDSDLRNLFAGCGEIKRCTIVKNMKSGSSKGVAFIEFADRQGAAAALALNGTELKGSSLSIVEKRTRQDNTQQNFFKQGGPGMMPPNPAMMNPAMMMAAASYWPMQAAMMRSAMMGPPRPMGGPMMPRMPRPARMRFPQQRPSYPPRMPREWPSNTSGGTSGYEGEDSGLWGPPATDANRWNGTDSSGEWSSNNWSPQRGRGAFRASRFGSGPLNRSTNASHPYSGGNPGNSQPRYPVAESNHYW